MSTKRLVRELKRLLLPLLIFVPGYTLSIVLNRIWFNCGPCQYRSYAGLVSGVTFFLMGVVLIAELVLGGRKKNGITSTFWYGILLGVLWAISGLISIAVSVGEIITGCQGPRC